MKHLLALSFNGQTIDAPSGAPHNVTFGKLFSTGILYLLLFAIIFSLFVIILSGIQWITSGGDKAKMETARNRLTFAIIGLLIALGSFLILNFFGSLFGIDFFGGTVSPGPDCGTGKPC